MRSRLWLAVVLAGSAVVLAAAALMVRSRSVDCLLYTSDAADEL